MPTGGLRPGIKCGAAKLTSDRAMQTSRLVPLLLLQNRKPSSLRAALVLPRASCSVVWGFGFRRTGLWARPRPGALGGALVILRYAQKTWPGPPGLCFLPRNFPGWPWGPAYRARREAREARGREGMAILGMGPGPSGIWVTGPDARPGRLGKGPLAIGDWRLEIGAAAGIGIGSACACADNL
jgi:hypothetical protein